MKIISKTRDYYDGIGALNADQTIHYVRSQNSFSDNDIPNHIKSKYCCGLRSYDGENYEKFFTSLIGFCGKIYPVITYRTWQPYGGDVLQYIYTVKKLAQALNLTEGELHASSNRHWASTTEKLADFTQGIKMNRGWGDSDKLKFNLDDDKLFLEFQVPAFVITQRSVILNPTLSDYNFQQIKDPFTTYQEIEFYFSNTLTRVKDPKVPVGNDVVIANSKGFDKYSFRKDKWKKLSES